MKTLFWRVIVALVVALIMGCADTQPEPAPEPAPEPEPARQTATRETEPTREAVTRVTLAVSKRQPVYTAHEARKVMSEPQHAEAKARLDKQLEPLLKQAKATLKVARATRDVASITTTFDPPFSKEHHREADKLFEKARGYEWEIDRITIAEAQRLRSLQEMEAPE